MKPIQHSTGWLGLALAWSTTTLSVTAQSWTNRYNGPVNGLDEARAIAVDRNTGNVYVTGSSDQTDIYPYGGDYATVAYTSEGVPLWTQRYNGPGNAYDSANAIAVDGSGNVYVSGDSTGSGTSVDYLTIKYSSAGVPLWTNRYNGPGNGQDWPEAMALDGNGNVYVTGRSTGSGTGYDYATIKYSSAGVPLWTQRYNGPGNNWDEAHAITVDGSGNVYVTGGARKAADFTTGDYATIKYSSTGVPLWTRLYDGPGNNLDGAKAVVADDSGNVYVTGFDSPTTNLYAFDYLTIAYTSAGVVRWTQRYNGPGNGPDEPAAMALDKSGNVYVTGSSDGSGTYSDNATIKYSSAGVPLWTQRYNGPANGYDRASAIAVDDSGNVYVTGESGGNGGDADYATVAYTSGGMPLWTRRYSGPGDGWDGATDIAVDADDNVYVTGSCNWNLFGTSPDYATIKYVPPLVDHFTCDTIPSPQGVDVPFPVTLTAAYLSGTTVTNFTGTVNLSGHAPGFSTANILIGTGSSAWGYPLYTRYHDARTQVIHRNSELGMACTINSLALEVTTAPGQSLTNWTIRMKHTSLAEYPLSPEWESSGWTVVYQGDAPEGSTGWRTFEFSTPFDYNGSDNLLVDFSFNNASYSSEGQCQSTVMGTYRSITYASDSKDGDPLTWSGTIPAAVRSYNVPNIMLGATYPDLLPVSLSPTVTTPFVNGVWTGEVTVHEAVTDLVLEAHSGDGLAGESNPFDVLAPEPPVIVTDDGQLDLSGGIFGFNVTGPVGQSVVVEVSTNLVDWLPLQTNVLGGSPWHFSDPDTANFTQRFYRAVTPGE